MDEVLSTPREKCDKIQNFAHDEDSCDQEVSAITTGIDVTRSKSVGPFASNPCTLSKQADMREGSNGKRRAVGQPSTESCTGCENSQNKHDSYKKTMESNLVVVKEKIIMTDELIKLYQRKCQDYEALAKENESLNEKLKKCYNENGVLRVQLQKANQANEPLKKTAMRFENETRYGEAQCKELKEQLKSTQNTFDDLRAAVIDKERMITATNENVKKLEKEKASLFSSFGKKEKEIERLKSLLKATRAAKREVEKQVRHATKQAQKLNEQLTAYKNKVIDLKEKEKKGRQKLTKRKSRKTNRSSFSSTKRKWEASDLFSSEHSMALIDTEHTTDESTFEDYTQDPEVAAILSAAVNKDLSKSYFMRDNFLADFAIPSPPMSPIPPSPYPGMQGENSNSGSIASPKQPKLRKGEGSSLKKSTNSFTKNSTCQLRLKFDSDDVERHEKFTRYFEDLKKNRRFEDGSKGIGFDPICCNGAKPKMNGSGNEPDGAIIKKCSSEPCLRSLDSDRGCVLQYEKGEDKGLSSVLRRSRSLEVLKSMIPRGYCNLNEEQPHVKQCYGKVLSSLTDSDDTSIASDGLYGIDDIIGTISSDDDDDFKMAPEDLDSQISDEKPENFSSSHKVDTKDCECNNADTNNSSVNFVPVSEVSCSSNEHDRENSVQREAACQITKSELLPIRDEIVSEDLSKRMEDLKKNDADDINGKLDDLGVVSDTNPTIEILKEEIKTVDKPCKNNQLGTEHIETDKPNKAIEDHMDRKPAESNTLETFSSKFTDSISGLAMADIKGMSSPDSHVNKRAEKCKQLCLDILESDKTCKGVIEADFDVSDSANVVGLRDNGKSSKRKVTNVYVDNKDAKSKEKGDHQMHEINHDLVETKSQAEIMKDTNEGNRNKEENPAIIPGTGIPINTNYGNDSVSVQPNEEVNEEEVNENASSDSDDVSKSNKRSFASAESLVAEILPVECKKLKTAEKVKIEDETQIICDLKGLEGLLAGTQKDSASNVVSDRMSEPTGSESEDKKFVPAECTENDLAKVEMTIVSRKQDIADCEFAGFSGKIIDSVPWQPEMNICDSENRSPVRQELKKDVDDDQLRNTIEVQLVTDVLFAKINPDQSDATQRVDRKQFADFISSQSICDNTFCNNETKDACLDGIKGDPISAKLRAMEDSKFAFGSGARLIINKEERFYQTEGNKEADSDSKTSHDNNQSDWGSKTPQDNIDSVMAVEKENEITLNEDVLFEEKCGACSVMASKKDTKLCLNDDVFFEDGREADSVTKTSRNNIDSVTTVEKETKIISNDDVSVEGGREADTDSKASRNNKDSVKTVTMETKICSNDDVLFADGHEADSARKTSRDNNDSVKTVTMKTKICSNDDVLFEEEREADSGSKTLRDNNDSATTVAMATKICLNDDVLFEDECETDSGSKTLRDNNDSVKTVAMKTKMISNEDVSFECGHETDSGSKPSRDNNDSATTVAMETKLCLNEDVSFEDECETDSGTKTSSRDNNDSATTVAMETKLCLNEDVSFECRREADSGSKTSRYNNDSVKTVSMTTNMISNDDVSFECGHETDSGSKTSRDNNDSATTVAMETKLCLNEDVSFEDECETDSGSKTSRVNNDSATTVAMATKICWNDDVLFEDECETDSGSKTLRDNNDSVKNVAMKTKMISNEDVLFEEGREADSGSKTSRDNNDSAEQQVKKLLSTDGVDETLEHKDSLSLPANSNLSDSKEEINVCSGNSSSPSKENTTSPSYKGLFPERIEVLVNDSRLKSRTTDELAISSSASIFTLNSTDSFSADADHSSQLEIFIDTIIAEEMTLLPHLSPLPPSPTNQQLPTLSPLPITPLPDTISPLLSPPKLASPPSIQGRGLMLGAIQSVALPRPRAVLPSASRMLDFTPKTDLQASNYKSKTVEGSNHLLKFAERTVSGFQSNLLLCASFSKPVYDVSKPGNAVIGNNASGDPEAFGQSDEAKGDFNLKSENMSTGNRMGEVKSLPAPHVNEGNEGSLTSAHVQSECTKILITNVSERGTEKQSDKENANDNNKEVAESRTLEQEVVSDGSAVMDIKRLEKRSQIVYGAKRVCGDSLSKDMENCSDDDDKMGSQVPLRSSPRRTSERKRKMVRVLEENEKRLLRRKIKHDDVSEKAGKAVDAERNLKRGNNRKKRSLSETDRVLRSSSNSQGGNGVPILFSQQTEGIFAKEEKQGNNGRSRNKRCVSPVSKKSKKQRGSDKDVNDCTEADDYAEDDEVAEVDNKISTASDSSLSNGSNSMAESKAGTLNHHADDVTEESRYNSVLLDFNSKVIKQNGSAAAQPLNPEIVGLLNRDHKQTEVEYAQYCLCCLQNFATPTDVVRMFSTFKNISSATSIISAVIAYLKLNAEDNLRTVYQRLCCVDKFNGKEANCTEERLDEDGFSGLLECFSKRPELTKMEQQILRVIAECMKIPHLNTILKLLLQRLPKAILSDTRLSNAAILTLCRLYTALSCGAQDRVRYKEFLFSVAFSKTISDITGIILISSFCDWPKFYANTKDMREIREEKELLGQVAVVITIQAIACSQASKDKNSPEYKSLVKIFPWLSTAENPLESVLDILLGFLESDQLQLELPSTESGELLGPAANDLIKAFELLSKYNGWEWCNDDLICDRMWGLCLSWSQQFSGKSVSTGKKVSDATVATVIRLIGKVSYMGIESGYTDFGRIIKMCSGILSRSSIILSVPPLVQLACACTLLDLSSIDLETISSQLNSWLEKTTCDVPAPLRKQISSTSYQEQF